MTTQITRSTRWSLVPTAVAVCTLAIAAATAMADLTWFTDENQFEDFNTSEGLVLKGIGTTRPSQNLRARDNLGTVALDNAIAVRDVDGAPMLHLRNDFVNLADRMPPAMSGQLVWDNGPADGVNAWRPTANWDPIGMIEDFDIPSHGQDAINFIHLEMIDGTRPLGQPSIIDETRIRLYSAPNGIGNVDVVNDSPVFDHTYTEASGEMTEIDSGIDMFSRDLVYFDLLGPSTETLSAGHYGMFVTFPGINYSADSFWATSNGGPDGGGSERGGVIGPDVPFTQNAHLAFRLETAGEPSRERIAGMLHNSVRGHVWFWEPGHVYRHVAGGVTTEEITHPSGGSLTRVRGIIHNPITGAVWIWNDVGVFRHTLGTTTEEITHPSGGPLVDVRGIIANPVTAPIWIWNTEGVFRNTFGATTTEEITIVDTDLEPVPDVRGIIANPVTASVWLWNGERVFNQCSGVPTTVHEITDTDLNSLPNTRGIVANPVTSLIWIWNDAGVYRHFLYTQTAVEITIVDTDLEPVPDVRGIIANPVTGLIWLWNGQRVFSQCALPDTVHEVTDTDLNSIPNTRGIVANPVFTNVWIWNDASSFMDLGDRTAEEITHPSGGPLANVRGICVDTAGMVWFWNDDGVFRYAGLHTTDEITHPSEGPLENVRSMMSGIMGTMWIWNNVGIFLTEAGVATTVEITDVDLDPIYNTWGMMLGPMGSVWARNRDVTLLHSTGETIMADITNPSDGPIVSPVYDPPYVALAVSRCAGAGVVNPPSPIAVAYVGPTTASADVPMPPPDPNGLTSVTAPFSGVQILRHADFGSTLINYDTAILMVTGVPPRISQHPADEEVCEDDSVSFTIVASGTPVLSYQWYLDGLPLADDARISGAWSPMLSIDPVVLDDAGVYHVVVSNTWGAAISDPATLTVMLAPAITQQPVDQFACEGGPATFSVSAAGETPLTYQWRKDGADIPGATGSSYIIDTVTSEHAGVYDVLVANVCGSVTSDPATLTVETPPSITVQPASYAVCEGDAVTFSVTAAGTLPLTYQWYKDGAELMDGGNISGANTDTLTIDPVSTGDAGIYDVVVTNTCGSDTSNPATLMVGQAGPLDNGIIRAGFADYGTSGDRFAQPPVSAEIAWLEISEDTQIYSWEGNLHYDDGGGPASHLLADPNEFVVDSPACRYDDVVLSASRNNEFTVRATHWLDGATLTTQLEITNTLAGDLEDVDFAWMMDADLVLPVDYEKEPCCPDLPWLGYGSGKWNGPMGEGWQNNLNPCARIRPANMAVVHTARMDGTVVPDEWTVSNPVGFQGATCAFDGEAQAEPRFLFETPFDNTEGAVGYDQDLGIVTNFRINTWEAGATRTFTYTLTFRSPDTGQGGMDGTPVEPVEIRRIPPP